VFKLTIKSYRQLNAREHKVSAKLKYFTMRDYNRNEKQECIRQLEIDSLK
jgi:hypothetical protein